MTNTKFHPEVLPSMTLDELRDFQSPDRLRARITELEAALRFAANCLEDHAIEGNADEEAMLQARAVLNSTTKGD